MNQKSIEKILLVEDNPGDARLLREMFNEPDLPKPNVINVGSMSEAVTHLGEYAVDIILLDLGLPDAQGLEAVRQAHAAAPRVPLIVLSGMDDESLAALALQEGAQDYLIKGQIDIRRLMRVMRYAIERTSMEEALFEEKERAQVTLNSIGDGVASTDLLGNIRFLNLAAEKMTGWPLEEATGRPFAEVLRILDATSREPVASPLEILTENNHPASNSILLRRDEYEIPIEGSISPIHGREGEAAGAVIVFRDVSAARAMALQITHSAEHDFLTGLPNRLLLNDRIGLAIASAQRHSNKVAVLFLDVDGFKHINDSLGHAIGDKLLQSISKRLEKCIRGGDTVSRQGGDEFVALLSEVERAEDTVPVASRMLQALGEVHSIDGHDLHVTASIGISIFPDDGPDA